MITLDKTKDLEDQLGWTEEETKAVLTKLYDKSHEICERLSKFTYDQLVARGDSEENAEILLCAASLATTPNQLFFMGMKANVALEAIGKQVAHNMKMAQMKASLAKMGPLGEMLEKNDE